MIAVDPMDLAILRIYSSESLPIIFFDIEMHSNGLAARTRDRSHL